MMTLAISAKLMAEVNAECVNANAGKNGGQPGHLRQTWTSFCFFGIYSQATETIGATLSSEGGSDKTHTRMSSAKNVLQNRVHVADVRHDGAPQALG